MDVWIARNLKTDGISAYPTKLEATVCCLKENRSDPDHPAFHLWHVSRDYGVIYQGRLYREFGKDFSDDPWTTEDF